MTNPLLPAPQAQDSALKEVADNFNRLSVINDLDPDADMVRGTDDLTPVIEKNDCQLDDEPLATLCNWNARPCTGKPVPVHQSFGSATRVSNRIVN